MKNMALGETGACEDRKCQNLDSIFEEGNLDVKVYFCRAENMFCEFFPKTLISFLSIYLQDLGNVLDK